ncbi:hypothetical protein [Streptomyces sp. NPDC059874]|uniref:hypothetical protein n=1 Tax=Streptomyces sp. NPDC059874 TaxID=3346983 RepID=UPI0036569562
MTAIQAAQARKFRGKNKAPKWTKPDEGMVSVMVLPLAVTDPVDLARLEKLFGAMWSIKRAIQRDARAMVDAYWAAYNEREEQGAKAVRQRLGISREALERCAYKHLEDSGHLKHHVSKALAMHMADEVWNGVQRHLFPDATGRRSGRPKVGNWHDFTRIPGRARSHITANKWETFRLVGTLTGHAMAYTDSGRHALMQPRRMPKPTVPEGRVPTGKVMASGKPGMRRANWWDHTGPLAVVFAGGPEGGRGDLVLPVRIPQQPGQWARVQHFLSNPLAWHKVDLVRRRKASAAGGWVYEAHLMVLGPGYAAPSVRAMRDRALQLGRVGGVDGNVSNLSVVSFPADLTSGKPVSTEVTLRAEAVGNAGEEAAGPFAGVGTLPPGDEHRPVRTVEEAGQARRQAGSQGPHTQDRDGARRCPRHPVRWRPEAGVPTRPSLRQLPRAARPPNRTRRLGRRAPPPPRPLGGPRDHRHPRPRARG